MAALRPMHGTSMTWLLTVSNAAVTQRQPPARPVVPRPDQNRHARRRTPTASLSLGPAQRRGARLGPALHAQTWSILPTCASALCQAAAIPPHLPYPNGHQRLRRLPIAVSSSTFTLRTCTLGPMPPSAPRARNYSGTSKHLFRTPTLLFEVSPPSILIPHCATARGQASTCTCMSSGPQTSTPRTGYSTWPSSASPDRLTTLGEPLYPRLPPPPSPWGGVLDPPLAAPRPPPSSFTNDGLRFTSPAVRPGQS